VRRRDVLAALGATVIIAEVTEAGADTARLIERAGGEALVQTDVSDPAAMAALADNALARFGKIDILINNAVA
jgi:NAD(P)-dependent dehydrogenase (short-subunit alcohol dehydrogenase family)